LGFLAAAEAAAVGVSVAPVSRDLKTNRPWGGVRVTGYSFLPRAARRSLHPASYQGTFRR